MNIIIVITSHNKDFGITNRINVESRAIDIYEFGEGLSNSFNRFITYGSFKFILVFVNLIFIQISLSTEVSHHLMEVVINHNYVLN